MCCFKLVYISNICVQHIVPLVEVAQYVVLNWFIYLIYVYNTLCHLPQWHNVLYTYIRYINQFKTTHCVTSPSGTMCCIHILDI